MLPAEFVFSQGTEQRTASPIDTLAKMMKPRTDAEKGAGQ
jgi:hypothetical protein